MTLHICPKCDRILSRLECSCGFRMFVIEKAPDPIPKIVKPPEKSVGWGTK